MIWYLAGALALTNLYAFILMGIDKRKAIKDVRRISEKALLTACGLFAAPGGLLGMHVFRHKTRKLKFKLGVPLMLIAQAAVIAVLTIYVF